MEEKDPDEKVLRFLFDSFDDASRRAREEKLAVHSASWTVVQYGAPALYSRMYTRLRDTRYRVIGEAFRYYASVDLRDEDAEALYSGKKLSDAALAVLRHASKSSQRTRELRRTVPRLRKKATSLPSSVYKAAIWFLDMIDRAVEFGSEPSTVAGHQKLIVETLIKAADGDVPPPKNREARGKAMVWLAENSRFLVRVNRCRWVLKLG